MTKATTPRPLCVPRSRLLGAAHPISRLGGRAAVGPGSPLSCCRASAGRCGCPYLEVTRGPPRQRTCDGAVEARRRGASRRVLPRATRHPAARRILAPTPNWDRVSGMTAQAARGPEGRRTDSAIRTIPLAGCGQDRPHGGHDGCVRNLAHDDPDGEAARPAAPWSP